MAKIKSKLISEEIERHLPNFQPSVKLRRLFDFLTSQIHKLDDDDLENMERLFAAVMGATRKNREGKHKSVTKYPGAKKKADKPRWADHGFESTSNDGEPIFNSDPYALDTDAILALAKLIEEGWLVGINGGDSSHFPGRTVRVTVMKKN